jgi:myo-inositol-1(or 4)-monophosphatase
MTIGTDHLLHTAKIAAQSAGKHLKKTFGHLNQRQVGLKGIGDYVTDLDRQSENIIIQVIKASFPDHGIHAEESGKEDQQSEYRWIVDPLDGTANYVQGIPLYGVSIACLIQNQVTVGVIYDPERDELFWAVKDHGAFLNGKAVHVSKKKEMAYSMLASGFPWRSKNYLNPYIRSFKDLFLQAAGLRRMGAAVIDLAYTACGRFDGFWEMKLQPWDIAAGILLIEEAGGVVTDFYGKEDFYQTGNVVAGNSDIHARILEVTKKYLYMIP